MPELDGLGTLEAIHRIYPDFPVVMMTAYGTVETAVASMKKGALDYLTKPIDLEELLLILHKVIERSTLIQENKELKARLREPLHPSTTLSTEARKWKRSWDSSPGFADSGNNSHPRRERDRERTDRQCHSLCKPSIRKALRQDELRRHP